MVILGFKLSLHVIWVPGYMLAVVAFIIYTAVVLYGPIDIKPGAIIVAIPDDALPLPKVVASNGDETPRGGRGPRRSYDINALRGTATVTRSKTASPAKTRKPSVGEQYRLPQEYADQYGEYRGYLGFLKYAHCAKGYTPKEVYPQKNRAAPRAQQHHQPQQKR